MDLCYIDESGTPDVPGNTSHYILAGLSIPDQFWRQHQTQLDRIKSNYQLDDAEIHVAWMMRTYFEQSLIPDFEQMSYERRRSEVSKLRRLELYRLQKESSKRHKQTRKNYRKTDAFVHLTLRERRQVVTDIARLISTWGVARLFAECIDKVHFDPTIAKRSVHEQVVSRFEQYLKYNDAG